jgi:hypothetical protein
MPSSEHAPRVSLLLLTVKEQLPLVEVKVNVSPDLDHLELNPYSNKPSAVEALMSSKLPLNIFFCRCVAIAERSAATAVLPLVITASSRVAANLGIAVAASIPMIAITKTSSNNVKALLIINS